MTTTAATPEQDLLRRRMEALTGAEIRMSEWEASFVDQVCWRGAGGVSPRQAATVALICWRHRDQLPPDLAPAKEPKLPPKRDPR